MALYSNFWVILFWFFFSHFQFKLPFQMRFTKFLSRNSRNFFHLSVLPTLQPRLAIWLSALGGSKPRISNKFLTFQSLAHFMWRNRLKQTVLVFLVTQNSHCSTNTFNLPFLGLNWIQVGRDESKHCTNLLLQLLLLTLSYVSSDSLWFLLKLLLLFLNLTIRHSLLFIFFYNEKAPSPHLSHSYSLMEKEPKITALWYRCVDLTSPLEGFLMQSTNEQINNTSLLTAQQKTYKINWGVKGGLGSGWCGEHQLHCSPFWISCRYTLVISVLWCWSEEVFQNLSLRWGCCNWPFSGSEAGWPGHGYLQRMRGELTKCWLLGRVKESASNIRHASLS